MAAAFDFSAFPTLVTPRLVLREMVAGDSADFFSFASDPEVQKYDSDPPMRETAEADAEIERSRGWFEGKQVIRWGVELKEENRLVGYIGFYFWQKVYYKTELGYTVARPYWRRGIATEAIRALMQFGFEGLCLHRINVDTRMDNTASVHLMQTLGFRHEGVRRECILSEDGTYQNWGIYGMLEDEYRQMMKGQAKV
jgi:[ribosomal protein S5]-alanine N-acetyltransferase